MGGILGYFRDFCVFYNFFLSFSYYLKHTRLLSQQDPHLGLLAATAGCCGGGGSPSPRRIGEAVARDSERGHTATASSVLPLPLWEAAASPARPGEWLAVDRLYFSKAATPIYLH